MQKKAETIPNPRPDAPVRPEMHTGKVTVYYPVYKMEKGWQRIFCDEVPDSIGIPPSKLYGKIIRAADFFSEAQAKALAYWFLAHHESVTYIPKVCKVGVRKYILNYSFEAEETELVELS